MKMKFFIKVGMKLNIISTLYYSIKFKFPFLIARGSIVSIKKGAQIIPSGRSRLFIGFHSINSKGAVLQLERQSKFIINGSVNIFPGAKVVVMEKASLSIKSGTFLNEDGRIQCRKNISIGKDCAISWGVLIIDSDFHGIYKNNNIINPDAAVKIGDRVWIGAKATVQKGANIENNTIIASHSLVLKGCYQPNTIYAGSPAKYISVHEGWGKL